MKPSRLLPLLALVAACSGSDSARDEASSVERPVATLDTEAGRDLALASQSPSGEAPPEPTGDGEPLPGEPSASLTPMLIRTGSATVRVDTLERGIAALRALARRHGGIVGTMTLSTGDDQARHATVELRIPSARFDSAIAGLAPIGRVEAVEVTAQDVGEEYADVQARVANARRLESRLLDLLERRTGRLEEMLQVEREVARVREQVERYEGRIRYLSTRASVSQLRVSLHEGEALLGSRPGERPLRDAFRRARDNFVALVAGLIAASGVLVPLLLLGFALWRAWRRLRRRDAAADRRPPAEQP